jgi:hypothetical protein
VDDLLQGCSLTLQERSAGIIDRCGLARDIAGVPGIGPALNVDFFSFDTRESAPDWRHCGVHPAVNSGLGHHSNLCNKRLHDILVQLEIRDDDSLTSGASSARNS